MEILQKKQHHSWLYCEAANNQDTQNVVTFLGDDTITHSNYYVNIILLRLLIQLKWYLHISFKILSYLLYLCLFSIEIRLKIINGQNLYFISNFLANVQCYIAEFTVQELKVLIQRVIWTPRTLRARSHLTTTTCDW